MTKEPLEVITVRLSPDMLVDIDSIVSNNKYEFDARSDFIRKTIEKEIKKLKQERNKK